MNSLCAVLALLSFLLFAATTESRIGAGGYKDNAIERKPMPENLWELMKEQSEIDNTDLSDDKDEKTDCHDLNNNGTEIEVAEFEVNIDDSEVTESSIPEEKPESNESTGSMSFEVDAEWPKANAFYDDFEMKPYISVYNN